MSKGCNTHPDVFFLYGRMSSVPIISLTSIQYRAEEICSHSHCQLCQHLNYQSHTKKTKTFPVLPTIFDGFTIILPLQFKSWKEENNKNISESNSKPCKLSPVYMEEERLKRNCLHPQMYSWGRSLKGHCLYWILQRSAHIQENADSSGCLWSHWCSDAVT